MTNPSSSSFPHQQRRDGTLFLEEVNLLEVAKSFGTPTYVYSAATLRESLDSYLTAFREMSAIVCVSVKTNSNLSLLKICAERGSGFDIVSGGELQRVLAVGADPKRVVFSGVGKTDEELSFALDTGILMLNVESEPELERVQAIAKRKGVTAPVSLRVNPDVDAKSHPYISTGLEDHKFGIPLKRASELYRSSERFPSLTFVGVDCHIGSMITDLSVFQDGFSRVASFITDLRSEVPTIRYADLGGGLGISYHGSPGPSLADYARIVERSIGSLGMTVVLEPGRSIFGNAGVLLAKVLFVKHGKKKNFLIVDAGMNDLIRPALYEAYHEISPVVLRSGNHIMADVVGPVCESGDCFAHGRELPPIEAGEHVVFQSAGAYGFTMASNYNSRPFPAEVLVDGRNVSVVKPRKKAEELFADELAVLRAQA
ncbi:MAG: diaminopimelate decarboxylase [Bdellovibrionota bacterium]